MRTNPSSTGPDNTLHVVHYIRHLREKDGAGVVRAVLDVSQALVANGCRVTFVTTDAGDAPSSEQATRELGPYVELINLPRTPFGRLAKDVRRRLESLLSTAAVLHLHTLWDPYNLQMAAIARKIGLPYVVTTHGMLNSFALGGKAMKKQVYLTLVGKRFLRGASRLHCTSEGEKRQVLALFPEANLFIAPLTFDAAEYSRLPGAELAESKFDALRRQGPKLLYLSRLHPIKGPDMLIEAVALLPQEVDWQLVMAGPGEENYVNRLKQLTRDRRVSERVSFVGMVSGDLKRSLYQACDLFVLPTEQENFGMVFVEALACGLPVVTTDRIDTAVELRAAGVQLTPRTVDDFVTAIRASLLDPEALRALGQRGRKYVFDWLDTGRVANRYRELYEEA